MLKRTKIQFQVCKNLDVKCSEVERVESTLREKLNNYSKFKNAYKYIDVVHKFVKAYDYTVHAQTGIAPSKSTDSGILTIWKRMNAKRLLIISLKAKFRVVQHVRSSKEKLKFAKASEQNLTQSFFVIVISFIDLQDPSTNWKI